MTIRRSFNVMLIGTGFGTQHAKWIFDNDCLNLCTVAYKTNREEAVKLAHEYGISNITCDAHEYIENGSIEVVCIVSPPSTHESFIMHAMEKGLYIISDKPLADTLTSAKNLHAIWSKLRAKVYFMFQWRNHPAIQRAYSILNDIGQHKFKDIKLSFNHNFLANLETPWKWRHSGNLGTGALSDLGAHMIDFLLYLFPDRWSVIHSQLEIVKDKRKYNNFIINCFSEDIVECKLESIKNNREAKIFCSRVSSSEPKISITANTDNERLYIYINPTSYDYSLLLKINNKVSVNIQSSVINFNPYNRIESILSGATNNDGAIATLEDAYHVQMIMEQLILKSRKNIGGNDE